MKIIHIMDDLGDIGGVESFVYDLCKSLIATGADVSLIGIIGEKRADHPQLAELRAAGVEVVCLGATSKIHALSCCMLRLRKELRRLSCGEPTVCNLHLKLSVLMGAVASIGMGNVRLVETYHSSYSHYEFQYALVHRAISRYVAISHTCALEMRRRFRTSDQEMTVIYNGIDRNAVRSSAGIDTNNNGLRQTRQGERAVFVSVARLSQQKNVATAVEAFSQIPAESCVYRVVGDGPLSNMIAEAASGAGSIELLGQKTRTEALECMRDADMVVMPSLYEGRSIVQLEAMALDKPMMLSDVPALREVFDELPLRDSESWRRCSWGYLVTTMNKESYRLAALDFMDLSEKDRVSMSERVREASFENDISIVSKKYMSVYADILSGIVE